MSRIWTLPLVKGGARTTLSVTVRVRQVEDSWRRESVKGFDLSTRGRHRLSPAAHAVRGPTVPARQAAWYAQPEATFTGALAPGRC